MLVKLSKYNALNCSISFILAIMPVEKDISRGKEFLLTIATDAFGNKLK